MSAVECGSTGERRLKLAGGGTLGFREYGDPDGAPLIFLHGWPSSSGQGIFLDGIGKARGLRVLSLDRPGFGASSFMPDRGFLHLPPLVEELAEALGLGKCYVLGVSGGGPYALACAYALPHRVRQAVVCGGAPPLDSAEARRKLWFLYRGLLAVEDRWPWLLKAGLAPACIIARVRPPWPVMKLLLRVLGARDREALSDRARFAMVFPAYREAMRAGHRAIYEDGRLYAQPWPFDPSQITVPVSVWHGTQDTNFHHSLAADLAARIPGAGFHLREEGHYSLPMFRAEEIIGELLDGRVRA